MHATAHGGCTHTVRESAPKGDTGRKVPCRTGQSNLRQHCAWLSAFQSDALPAELLAAVSTVLQQHFLLYLFSLSARTGRESSSNKIKFAVTDLPFGFSAANL